MHKFSCKCVAEYQNLWILVPQAKMSETFLILFPEFTAFYFFRPPGGNSCLWWKADFICPLFQREFLCSPEKLLLPMSDTREGPNIRIIIIIKNRYRRRKTHKMIQIEYQAVERGFRNKSTEDLLGSKEKFTFFPCNKKLMRARNTKSRNWNVFIIIYVWVTV